MDKSTQPVHLFTLSPTAPHPSPAHPTPPHSSPQMFSTAITQQSEQIEQLYSAAVEATQHISKANVQLGKAVKTNSSARKYMLAFFLVASLCLLFLDWWYS